MPTKSRQDLYSRFATGKKPTQDDFADLIDSMINIAEDGIGIAEQGEPMEIIERGDEKRLLDFASGPDNPIWRINARSADGERSGLNISSNERSRLFIEKDSGYTGLNNDAPAAKLHITPTAGGSALQVDKVDKDPALIIGGNGDVSIGTNPQDAEILTVNGGVNLNGTVDLNGEFNVTQGMTVTGAALQAKQGLIVENGASIDTGMDVKERLTVNGLLTANAGAIINKLPLEVTEGLIINKGATVETGALTANAGVVVNGAQLNANAGAVVSGAILTVNNGLTVAGTANINGHIQANEGLTVNNSTLVASGEVNLGNAKSGTVTVDGQFVAKKGIILEDSLFRAEQGMIISEGDLSVENNLNVDGELIANTGLTVNDSALQATGQVILGNADNGNVFIKGVLQANKGIVVKEKALQAQSGVVVTGAELLAENGIKVKNGATIETGLLTINEGVSIANGATFNANGIVNLGNTDNGVVTINGELKAVNGGTISGANLQVRNGLLVSGSLNAPDESNFGTVSIQTLNVTDINVTGSLGLTSIDLVSLGADSADIRNLNIESNLNVNGQCKVIDDTVLAGGRLVATYEGSEAISPRIMIRKGNVDSETGHFDISIDDNKQATIIYDDSSDLTNFINDWKTYQYTHAIEAEGFGFRRIGSGSGKLKDEEIKLIPSAVPIKEYRIPNNGLKIIYTGTQPGTPQFMIRNTEDRNSNKFDFVIQDLVLGIFCPTNIEDRTVNNLLESWFNWKNINQDLAADFEIRQTGDKDWQLDDILEIENLLATGDVVREFKLGELIISNTSNLQNQPRFIINAAAPGFEAGVGIEVSLETLTITLGTADNSPKAIYNAWENWVKNDNETYGFVFAETNATTPIKVFQQESLDVIDDTHSQVEAAGIVVTYTGSEAGLAKILLQEGVSDSFSFSFDDQNKQLTIDYPANVIERTVATLLLAWEGITDKHGFEISGSGDGIFVRQAETMETITAVIKEYQPVTSGVDNITIRYTGPEVDTPGVIMLANDSNGFDISISAAKIIIKYPPDKSSTIDQLLDYWEGLSPVGRDGFSLIKNGIENTLVNETSANLVVNDANRFSQGVIRTNTVTIDGYLKFGESQNEISAISNSEVLAENSDAILTTQKAVKSYIDNGLALKADQDFVTEELAKKADQSFVTNELTKKADQGFVTSELAKKANQSFTMEELAKKADQSFVTDELGKKADQSFVTDELEKVNVELDLKADASAMATALATKSNLLTPAELLVEPGSSSNAADLSLNAVSRGILMVVITMAGTVKAGIFGIHGMESIIKVAGDGFADQEGNPGTWNVYAAAGAVMIENASSDTIIAQVSYFGV